MPVMLPTVIRNLFGGPATRMYPVQVREPFEGARGHMSLMMITVFSAATALGNARLLQ